MNLNGLESAEDMQDLESMVLVGGMVRSLVDKPDLVKLELIVGSRPVLKVQVDHADVGKIIGKQGRTARSLRTILGASRHAAKRPMELDLCGRKAEA